MKYSSEISLGKMNISCKSTVCSPCACHHCKNHEKYRKTMFIPLYIRDRSL